MKHVIDNRLIGSKVMFRQYHVQDNKKTGETFTLIKTTNSPTRLFWPVFNLHPKYHWFQAC